MIDRELAPSLIRFCRAAVGLIALWRATTIAIPGWHYWDPNERLWPLAGCIAYGACGLLLVLGRFRLWPLFALALINVPVSMATQTMNLGPLAYQSLLIALLFGDTGQQHLARVALLACIGANHFCAMMFHLTDSYWLSGKTLSALLTNTFMFKGAALVQAILLQWPEALPKFLFALSASGLVLQSIWQLAMLPLAVSGNRWAVGFVKWYGWLFIGFSFFLNLSSLPFIETIAWIFIFGLPLPIKWAPDAFPQAAQTSSHFGRLFLIGWISFSIVFALGHIHPSSRTRFISLSFVKGTMYLGLWGPHVFNSRDLMSGDSWVTVRVREAGRRSTLLPINDEDGSRLWWHNSDLLYFTSLLMRISIPMDQPFTAFGDPHGQAGSRLLRLLQFDYRVNSRRNDTTYSVTFHRQRASEVDLPPSVRLATTKQHLYELRVKDGRIAEVAGKPIRTKALREFLQGREMGNLGVSPVDPFAAR